MPPGAVCGSFSDALPSLGMGRKEDLPLWSYECRGVPDPFAIQHIFTALGDLELFIRSRICFGREILPRKPGVIRAVATRAEECGTRRPHTVAPDAEWPLSSRELC
jgi:hypothetical protein